MKRINFMFLLFVGFALTGCYPQYDPVYTEDLDLVITNYDNKFNFGNIKQYALPDSVVRLTGEEADGNIQYATPAISNTILTAIRRNMNANGWVEVDESVGPDVIILPTTTQTTNVYYYYSMGYWGGYYPGYYPGWGYGWGYPMYYPPVATSYKTGSLLMQMTYPSDTAVTGRVSVLWTGLVNGLLEGTNAEIQVRVNNTIDQAFKQSPYLKK